MYHRGLLFLAVVSRFKFSERADCAADVWPLVTEAFEYRYRDFLVLPQNEQMVSKPVE